MAITTDLRQLCVCVCVCLLLQYLLQSCSRGGRGIVEDMCYERRRTSRGLSAAAHSLPSDLPHFPVLDRARHRPAKGATVCHGVRLCRIRSRAICPNFLFWILRVNRGCPAKKKCQQGIKDPDTAQLFVDNRTELKQLAEAIWNQDPKAASRVEVMSGGEVLGTSLIVWLKEAGDDIGIAKKVVEVVGPRVCAGRAQNHPEWAISCGTKLDLIQEIESWVRMNSARCDRHLIKLGCRCPECQHDLCTACNEIEGRIVVYGAFPASAPRGTQPRSYDTMSQSPCSGGAVDRGSNRRGDRASTPGGVP